AERRGLALAAATGQASEAKALDRARDAQRKAEMEHEDLSAALTQAEEKVREAEAAVAAAESARRSAEARRLADRRVEAARKIERLIRMLGPAVTDYRSLGHQIARAARTNATPLNADWRLRGHINQMLGLDHVDPALRCPNLAEMERHTLDQVLHYAMKEE
ncbi:MAG: hypothetical protein HOK81_11165, partial [Rhodospirillaceae bacterium]|nr:hypothetical protein [Rhodospirillaceae bacterium]